MALYDFKCDKCDVVEEFLLNSNEMDLVVDCQFCGLPMARQLCFPKGVVNMGQSMKDAGYTPKIEIVGTGFTKPDKSIGGQKFTKSDWE